MQGNDRKPLVMGNWKMNGRLAGAVALAQAIRQGLASEQSERVEVVVVPPFPHLVPVGQVLSGSAIGLGAQNLAVQSDGAFTGEVSGEMLTDAACTWVLVGHSERRQFFGDSGAVVAARTRRALDIGLKPVVCIGESLAERESGAAYDVLARQIDEVAGVLRAVPADQYVLAYEPVWAIGTGRTAEPQQVAEVHGFLRQRLVSEGFAAATGVRLLYGGSVKAALAPALFAQPDVDGGLIGGAALVADEFLAICGAAAARGVK